MPQPPHASFGNQRRRPPHPAGMRPVSGVSTMVIDSATESDLAAILEIYNDVIANSTAVYTAELSTLDERRGWWQARRRGGFPILVAREAGEVVGFSSYGEFRAAWPGYRHTVEHSVHVRPDHRARGIGQALLSELVGVAERAGQHVMLGAIDADNAASLALHLKLGFARVAHFREVGRKFDRWLDLVFMQRLLAGPDVNPHD